MAGAGSVAQRTPLIRNLSDVSDVYTIHEIENKPDDSKMCTRTHGSLIDLAKVYGRALRTSFLVLTEFDIFCQVSSHAKVSLQCRPPIQKKARKLL